MHLRNLELKDAERMFAWMQDPFVVEKLQTDFSRKTLNDCRKFIQYANNKDNLHLAITDDDDRYMGTVSLKNITAMSAEFAITVCRDAMGIGYAIWAMQQILQMAFEKYGLEYVYWCVAADNMRALRFYEKNLFPKVDANDITIVGEYSPEQIERYIWFRVLSPFCKGKKTGKNTKD